MISNVLSVFCGGFVLAAGGRSGSDRDSLLSLLEQVDTSSNIGNLLDRVPLHMFGSLLETRVLTTSDTSRRRHNPCEANDASGDGDVVDCLNRRFSMLGSVIQQMSTPDSNGITPDSGRLQLRAQYADLLSHYAIVSEQTQQIYTNITNPTNGSIHLVDFATRKVFNRESLMALSVNNAWMNLISATNIASGDIDDVLRTRDNATEQIAKWFNALQTAEEIVTYENQQQVLDAAWNSLNKAASTISDSQTQVWKVLTDLDNSMGGSEDLSGNLASTLSDAAESVDSSLNEFEQSLPEVAANAEQNVNQTLDNLASQYGSTAQRVVESVQSTSADKQRVAQTSAETALATQVDSIYNATMESQRSIDRNIAALTSARDRFLNYSETSYAAAQDAINVNISIQTADIQNRSAAVTSSLGDSDAIRARISNLINDVNSNEKQAVGNSGSNRLSELSSATAAINDIATAIASKSQSTLQMAQQVSSGAIAAVGTSSQGPLNDLSDQYDEQQTVAANQANQIALDSQSAASSLASSSAAGSNQMSSTGSVVNGQVDDLAGTGMDGVENVAGSLPGAVDLSKYHEMVQSAAEKYSSTSAYYGDAASMAAYDAAQAASNSLNEEAERMGSAGAAAEASVGGTLDSIDLIRKLSGYVTKDASSVPEWVGSGLTVRRISVISRSRWTRC